MKRCFPNLSSHFNKYKELIECHQLSKALHQSRSKNVGAPVQITTLIKIDLMHNEEMSSGNYVVNTQISARLTFFFRHA